MRALAGLLAISCATVGLTAASAQNGAATFRRCAACHLADRSGVPNAFPPLKINVVALASSPAGRKYLALVVLRGLSGPIAVGGKVYRGTMPAQGGLNDGEIATLLSYLVQGSKAKPFTPSEVAGYRAIAAAIPPSTVAKQRPAVGDQ
jgi:mono/diheme cytochrome c family protein